MANNNFHDPLTMNIARQIRVLLSKISPLSPYAAFLKVSAPQDLLANLSRLLAIPALTLPVANTFRPLLLPLCARWLYREGNEEETLVALCLLIQPHEELFPVLSEHLRAPFFANGPLAFLLTSQSLDAIDNSRLHRLLLAYYRILLANPELPRYFLWPLSPLSVLFWNPHPDTGVRLLAIRCYAMQSGMGEAEREKLEKEVLGEICGVDCPIEYEQDIHGNTKTVDCWILPAFETKRVIDARNALALDAYDYYTVDPDDVYHPLLQSDLGTNIANIHGVILLRFPGPTEVVSALIDTPLAIQALRALATHLSLRHPTLLTSPPSTGKALLLSHLAWTLHPGISNQIVNIHLADTSMDPRSLLGAYESSSTRSGTFEWKEGILVRAMKEGRWIVFKDIDKASSETLGIIKPLVESLRVGKWIGGRASLDVPSRGRVEAHANFALFATRSVVQSSNGNFPPPVFFGASKFHEITILSPTSNELKTIMCSRFPRLENIIPQAIIPLWEAVRACGSATSAQEVGFRELEKFCARVGNVLPASHQSMDICNDVDDAPLTAIFPNPMLREDLFAAARDVFFGGASLTASSRARADAIAVTVAERLGLEPDRRDWVLRGRASQFQIEKDPNDQVVAVYVGRVRLPAKPMEEPPTAARPFVLHRPAVVLLSRIVTALSLREPVLLTGETATGKTSAVTHLASLLRRPLISLNLSHQTESSDLIGGFKPVDARIPASVLQGQFLELFGGTFSRRKNPKFTETLRQAVLGGRWKRVVATWKEAVRLAKERLQPKQLEEIASNADRAIDEDAPRKRLKIDQTALAASETAWRAFERDVDEFEVQYVRTKGKFAFGFVEGPFVKALRSGDWVLLDEINLATPETLECISTVLRSPNSSITLAEQGSLEPVRRHPDFRLFACMNPANDVGKKDLPPHIRSRFTEIDVPSADSDRETLLGIITQYIGACAIGDKAAILNAADFYSAVKKLAEARQIADRSNHAPHYNLRTLIRALTFVADMVNTYGLRRSLWEGCLMAFTMVLDTPSAELVTALAETHLLAGVRNPRSMLSKEPSYPHSRSAGEFLKLGPFYLEKGHLPADPVDDYIMTPSVETKLVNLARIITTRRFPVLIEGHTSSGKTSSVEYLARRTGHRFIRINNHEHTDLQEYLGCYVPDPTTGKLVFQDGLLVRALRDGDWIVLDELNLAPTDVLEALNRLLDDNRELVIPETQEVVRPHAHFMLFATQNPPGLYAGRKVLSRAFRSRFLELHFEDLPQAELEFILCQRCRIAPSYGQRIAAVFRELQKRRQSSRVFESKHGFATLRDLFRWAGREAVGYQELAENGYMILAERARREDDKIAVKEVIESEMRVQINENTLYNLRNPTIDYNAFLGCRVPSSSQLVWTSAMQRLFILVTRALRFNEPVLLVGETGSGKTSVCQVYADTAAKHLHSLSCHQNTETADLIGGLRPVRSRSAGRLEVLREVRAKLKAMGIDNNLDEDSLVSTIDVLLKMPTKMTTESRSLLEDARRQLQRLKAMFEWQDGPLVDAMRDGDVFLLDEISLADDSVLERLNSVLDPGRKIVLSEKGGSDIETSTVQAADGFKLMATMNPGGDYGKKELSPALRNRFTEIWVPPVSERADLELIIGGLWEFDVLRLYTDCLLDFREWLCTKVADRSLLGLRDIIAWVAFSNSAYHPEDQKMSPKEIFWHAAHMTLLDGLAAQPQLATYSPDALRGLKAEALLKLQEILSQDSSSTCVHCDDPARFMQFGPFTLAKGPYEPDINTFNLNAATTRDNAMRVVRAFQVSKPILLEGSPGVGKTSLVTALADISGHVLYRINLSDQTDLVDLFGSDLPVEGGHPGEFAWKDAEFLKALQEGHWVLLDEMNLAPQAVLEGLNAVLDHRGTVYIPELGRLFTRHPEFRIFAAQNPLHQGGGRKGLPKSFVNRFTKVYLSELSDDDLLFICQDLFPNIDSDILRRMVDYNTRIAEEIRLNSTFAREGAPWEFNLRDIIRWGTLLSASSPPPHPVEHLRTVYLHRFRTVSDRNHARLLFEQVFSMPTSHLDRIPYPSISSTDLLIGNFRRTRRNFTSLTRSGCVLQSQLPVLESVGLCILQSWLSIITGPTGCGKSELIRTLASIMGYNLLEISINSATDTMDLLGSFEQVDIRTRLIAMAREVLSLIDDTSRSIAGSKLLQIESYRSLLEELQLSPTSISIPSLLQSAESLAEQFNLDNLNNGLADLISRLRGMRVIQDTTSQFEWVDGPLIQAMKRGDWVLLDGANLCSPSVLDRLNSLCEPNGVITLSERGLVGGQVQTLKPHPDFRLFMSVDPQYGELSRAMRNRGVELAVMVDRTHEDQKRLRHYVRLPSVNSRDMDFEALTINFDATRRSIDFPKVLQKSTDTFWPSGRAIHQDSPLSTLLELAPFFLVDLSSSLRVSDPLLYSFARIVTPSYMRHLGRFLMAFRGTLHKQIDQLQGLLQRSHSQFLSTTAALRRAHCRLKGTTPDFLLSQPTDFFMSCNPCEDCKLEPGSSSAHRIIMAILNVCVALDICESELALPKEAPGSAKIEKRIIQSREYLGGHKTRGEIEAIVEAIPVTCRAMLNSCDSDNLASKSGDFDLAFKLLTFTRPLRIAVADNSLDYSAIQATLKLISQSPRQCSQKFAPLLSYVKAIEDSIWSSSGLGLMEIWSTLLSEKPLSSSEVDLAKLDAITCHLKEAANIYELRKQGFQLMALRTLPAGPTDEQCKTLSHLSTQVEQRLLANQRTDGKCRGYTNNISFLIAELGVLSELGGYQGTAIPLDLIQRIQEIVDLNLINPYSSLLRHTSYQHVLWSTSVESATLPTIMRSHVQWLDSLWNPPQDENEGGPQILFQPTQLRATMRTCDWRRKPLSSLKRYEASVHRQARLSFLLCEFGTSRIQQLMAVLQRSLLMIASCFTSSFDEATGQMMQDLSYENQLGTPATIERILSLLEKSSNDPFRNATQHFLHPTLQRFVEHFPSRQKTIANLGWCWVALGRMIIDLYVPDKPIDPALVQHHILEFGRQEEASLSSQIRLHSQHEHRSAGNDSNTIVEYLYACSKQISESLSTASPHLSQERHNVSNLEIFWKEVSQFMTQVTSPARIDSLLRLEANGETASMRESVIQQSITGFCRRLDVVYPQYLDINTPLQLALSYMKLGLRLMTHSATCDLHPASQSIGRVCEALVAFPMVRSTAMLIAEPETSDSSGKLTSRLLLLRLASIGLERSFGVDLEKHISSVEMSYDQILRLWLIDRARENDMDLASQSLYRHKRMDDDLVSGAEAEEQEFLALFPQFEDSLQRDPPSEVPDKQKVPLVDTPQILQLVDIHCRLFSITPFRSESAVDPLVMFNRLRESELRTLLHNEMTSLPEIIDSQSLALQFSLLQNRLSGLRGVGLSTAGPPNFYTDSNVFEVKKASTLVETLKNRLDTLSQEWPDQMVLQHLKDRCDLLLELDLHTPVARVLSALEQLLTQSEDWELFANRENTLKDHQQAIAGLIVDWRRLELSSWQALLQAQARSFAEGASHWWFRLYDITIRGPLDILGREVRDDIGEFTNFLNKLVPLLDDFIRTSPLGQYRTRMRLLQSFSSYASHLSLTKPGHLQLGLRRVWRILQATTQYYDLYSVSISRQLMEQQAAIEKEILGFIKLASWKDTNVQALKQSAQKTHRQLYKCIRKFRDAMRQPIVAWLQPELAGDAESKPLIDDVAVTISCGAPSFPDEPSVGPRSNPLVNLRKTFQKFDALIDARIFTFIRSRTAHRVDSLAIDIILTAKTLNTLSVSNSDSAERRQKLQAALLVRKRKAWNDLLKELKRGGFAANMKPEILDRQSDVRWMREQPIIFNLTAPFAHVKRSETYFSRLQGSLPELRNLIANHHPDITTRELQRAVTLLESGFSMALDMRSSFAEALEASCNLDRLCRRLKMIGPSRIITFNAEIPKRVSHIGDTLCKLANTLDELSHGLQTFNNLQLSKTVTSSLIHELHEIITTTKAFRDQLLILADHVKLTPFSFLLDRENTLILNVRRHFKSVSSSLRHWLEGGPYLRHLLHPIQTWLDAQEVPLLSVPEPQPMAAWTGNTDSVIEILLVSVQGLLAICPDINREDTLTERDHYIRTDRHHIHDLTRILNLNGIFDHLNGALPCLATCPPESSQRNIARFLPFLDRYMGLVEEQLVAHSQWMKALFKLVYVLCSVMHSVAKQGFCRPPDMDGSESVGDTLESGGVGLGEGSGNQNVSKEIDEEHQIEGLQGEGREPRELEETGEDDEAIEMDDNFDGELEDAPDTGPQEENKSDEENQADLEEQVGKLNPLDPSAVDEKLWGDDGRVGQGEDEKVDPDRSTRNEGSSEVVAKESKRSQNPSDEKELSPERDEGSVQEENGDEERPSAEGAPIDNYTRDAEILDLPDDMDLDFGAETGDDYKEDEDDVMEFEQPETISEDDEETVQPSNEAPNDNVDAQNHQAISDEDVMEDVDAVAPPDVSTGEGASAYESHNSDGTETIPTDKARTPSGTLGNDSGAKPQSDEFDSVRETSQPLGEPGEADTGTEGSTAVGSHRGSAQSQLDKHLPNPIRNLGDFLTEIQRRFETILERDDSAGPSRDQLSSTADVSQVEYAHPNDADHEMQALGPAGQEEVAKLNELRIVDDEIERSVPMDIDLPLEREAYRPAEDESISPEPSRDTTHEPAEGVFTPFNKLAHRIVDNPPNVYDTSLRDRTSVEMDDAQVEVELKRWQAEGQPQDRTEHIWRLYESLTHNLAYALCEQLRLILEPTRATRLRGDYRTGKRLNMKRIISYIASDYTKDKIWLRRMRPSQREYQVLIALDDSRSMAESHSIHLAYQTLAMVSKALSRLEVGDIAIVKFGGTVDIVHGFDDGPFADRAGPKIVDAFRFNQTATNVLSLVQTSLEMLQSAREHSSMNSSSAADLWQLEIIISDGICQDHDRLRTILRKAEEQRVMIVFIIIDSLHSNASTSRITPPGQAQPAAIQNSILSMKQARYKNVEGRMELQTERYLDSFPFEYYVVLRDVEALPDVFSGTLKQFFERISEE